MRIGRLYPALLAGTCVVATLAIAGSPAGCSSDSDTEPTKDGGLPDAPITLPPPDKTDGGDAGGACDLSKPFGQPVLVPGGNAESSESGMPSFDELTFYSMNAKKDWFHLYSATRTSKDAEFGPPTLLKNVNNTIGRGDYDPYVSYDGLELFFSSERDGTDAKNFELYYATRASTKDDFSPPIIVPTVNTTSHDRSPSLSPDKKTLYFSSNGYGFLKGAIYKSVRSGSNFGPATHVDLRDTTKDAAITDDGEGSPILSLDGLTLFFNSGRTGGKGNGDIWMATRPTTDVEFSNPTNVGALANVNTEFADGPRGISPDGCRLYLVSYRPAGYDAGTYGGATMWVASRPK